MAKREDVRDFLRDVDPAACSIWVMTYRNAVVVSSYTLCIIRCLVTSSVVHYFGMQEKEQDLIEACKRGDLDEAQRLIGSGVSVKCRTMVCIHITRFLKIRAN